MYRIIDYIENDFEGYFDDLYFELRKRSFLDFRGKGLWRKTDGTIFFHDKDCKANDREKLVQRVSRRIENFRQILNSEKPILFVLYILDSDADLERLYNVISKIRGEKFFKIAVLDFNSVVENFSNCYLLDLPSPIENYHKNWNRSSFVKSKLGIYFEECIVRFIKNIIKKDFENRA